MTELTNKMRADFAGAALATYTNSKGIEGEALETRITDLLIDLQHLARLNRLPWRAMRDRAARMHRVESADDPD